MYNSIGFKPEGKTKEDVKKEIIREGYSIFEDRFVDAAEAREFISELDWGLDDIWYELKQYDKKYNTDFSKIKNIVDLCNTYYFVLCEEIENEAK